MESTSMASDGGAVPREAPPLHPLAGVIVVALVDVVTLATRSTHAALPTRLAVHFRVAFHLIAIGLAITGVAIALDRMKRRSPRVGYGLLAALSAALAYPVLGEDLSGIAAKLPGAGLLTVWTAALAVLAAQVIPLGAALGSLVAIGWIRLAGVAVAALIAAANGQIDPQSYPGLHLLASAFAAALAGGSLRGASFLQRAIPGSARARLALAAGLSLAAVASIVVPPGNATAVILAAEPCAVLSPYLGEVYAETNARRRIPPEQAAWFTPRHALPPVPPSTPRLLPQGAIVLLVGIDSLRADVLADEANRATLPTLFALQGRSTYFTRARSAGASTAPSMAAIFSSAYYSQLYWTRRDKSNDPFVYPHKDTTPRFPELLAAAGVRTVTVDSLGWLVNEHGIVRGFQEQTSRKSMNGRAMVDKVIERLASNDGAPLFVFAHLTDAHYPYGNKGEPWEGYLRQLGYVDKQIGRLLAAIRDQHLEDRTALVVMSDHGEAFGEHGTNTHSQNVYDVLLRVPLLFQLPGGRAQVVDDPVSLVDLGPTILDLFGVETPGRYMGQSLVGHLRGERPALLRPIAAEARLKRAIVTPDGFKVIRDPGAHSIEIFDLGRDPGEENNLYDEGSPRSSELLGVLDAFIHGSTLKRPGYKVPYRKW